MSELSIVKQREIGKKIDINFEVEKVLKEMRKIAGDRQFNKNKEKGDSLRRAALNVSLGNLIKRINNSLDDPEQACASLWQRLVEDGIQSHYFEDESNAKRLQVGILAEVAAETSFLSQHINSCHADPERDVREKCDLLIYPNTPEEICLQIKADRDSDRRRKPDVNLGMNPGGYKATLVLNYPDKIGVFCNHLTGQPTQLFDRLLLKELKNNHLMN